MGYGGGKLTLVEGMIFRMFPAQNSAINSNFVNYCSRIKKIETKGNKKRQMGNNVVGASKREKMSGVKGFRCIGGIGKWY